MSAVACVENPLDNKSRPDQRGRPVLSIQICISGRISSLLQSAMSCILESRFWKPRHQLDNLDTAYKCDLLTLLSDSFTWDTNVPAGTLQLIQPDGATVECTLILMSDWKEKLPTHLK